MFLHVASSGVVNTFSLLQEAKEEWLRAVQQDEGFAIIGLKRRHWPGQSVPESSWDSEFRCKTLAALSQENSIMLTGAHADGLSLDICRVLALGCTLRMLHMCIITPASSSWR